MLKVYPKGIVFVGKARDLPRALQAALRSARPGITLLEYCREHGE